MRHLKRGRKLNRTASHRKAMFRNMASSLILHRRIHTTDAKAKELRKFIEPLVTFALQGTLHARRQVLKALPGQQGQEMTAILFNDIAPLFTERPGGYTRIIKLGNRTNDRAPVSLIEFVEGAPPVGESDDDAGKGKSAKKDKGKKDSKTPAEDST